MVPEEAKMGVEKDVKEAWGHFGGVMRRDWRRKSSSEHTWRCASETAVRCVWEGCGVREGVCSDEMTWRAL